MNDVGTEIRYDGPDRKNGKKKRASNFLKTLKKKTVIIIIINVKA